MFMNLLSVIGKESSFYGRYDVSFQIVAQNKIDVNLEDEFGASVLQRQVAKLVYREVRLAKQAKILP